MGSGEDTRGAGGVPGRTPRRQGGSRGRTVMTVSEHQERTVEGMHLRTLIIPEDLFISI